MSVTSDILALISKVDSQDDLKTISSALTAHWRVLQGTAAQQPVVDKQLRPGTPVSFFARGRTIYGTVKNINPKTCSVEPQDGGPAWRVSPQLLTKLDKLPEQQKRTEADLMAAILDCYGSLSPENLTGDGELPRHVVERKRRELHSKLDGLFRELGRRVSEAEAYEWGCKNPSTDPLVRRPLINMPPVP